MSDQARNERPAPFKIAGFPIQASPTVWVLFGLIAFTTAQGLLPSSVPGASPTAYWVGGLTAAALLLGSLLVHELAHAIVARRHGIKVEGVTFWLFGGLAKLGSNASSPKAEWRIASVGPATNLVLAAIGFGVVQAMAALSVHQLVVAVAGYFVTVNILLGVFNLLPAAPLDGGRVLRAVLWRRFDDRDRATVAAARAGQVIAAGVIGWGFVQLLGANTVGGLWTGLIGFFLFNAATSEARMTVTQSALAGLRVADVLPGVTQAPAAPGWFTIENFLDAYRRSGDTRSVVPLQSFDGSFAGLVSLRRLGTVAPDQRDVVRVSAVAAPADEVTVTGPDELLVDLVPRLVPRSRNLAAAQLAGYAAVVRDGQVIAVIGPADFQRAIELSRLATGQNRQPPPDRPSDNLPTSSALSSHDRSSGATSSAGTG
jgi:Zn-dependent protease